VLVDFVDVDSAKWSEYAASRRWPWSWIYTREGERLLAAERAIAAGAQRSFFVTSAEAALFRRLAPESADKVEAISNGVDADYFSHDPQRPTPYRDDEIPIVFTGAMDYWPNVDAVTWFAAEVLPALRARRPNVRFYIVGMRPAPAVQALAGDAVVVTGAVPDVRPYVQHAAVAVAPLRVARGIQNKVLEAMAMSAAVVTSKACARAIEGVTPGEVVGAQGAAAFVSSVEALLADRPRARSLGESARRFVLEHYSWQRRLDRMRPYLEGGRAPAQPDVAAPHASEEAFQ
jgi:sugar transferase (PEP-CTERM/EpsH1 system associated)